MRTTPLFQAVACLIVCTAALAVAAQPPGPPDGPPTGPPPFDMPAPPEHYNAVLDIKDGARVANPATAAALSGGKLTDHAASGLRIRSTVDQLNGVFVRGKSVFALSDAQIELGGKGLNDFFGIAAGAFVKDDATLVLRKVKITTRGIVSTAATAADHATLKVYDSTLASEGGPVPSGYVRRIGPGMMEPPTPLGIIGTARTVLTMGAAKAYFYDSTITAEGWGALSTDAAQGAYLEANRCDIRVRRSGYGAYADHGATVVINDSKMDVATFMGVIAGQADMSFNQVRGRSDGNAVMIHNVMGSPGEVATLAIKGGQISTRNAAILVKSANADISIDSASISSVNGDLLLGVVNDDANATAVKGRPVAGIKAVLRNSRLVGNILQLDTDRAMTVSLLGTQLAGAVRNVSLSLDAASRWRAVADSSVRLEGPVQLAQIDAPAGVRIEVTGATHGLPVGQHVLAGGGLMTVAAN